MQECRKCKSAESARVQKVQECRKCKSAEGARIKKLGLITRQLALLGLRPSCI
jgi:hypothetical protein